MILTENLTEQRIFDHVVLQLALQGGPSKTPNGQCTYRGENGRKCGVGFLLTDDEVNVMGNYSGIGFTSAPKRLRPFLDFLRRVQGAHDVAFSGKDNNWRDQWEGCGLGVGGLMSRVADDFGLDKGVLYSAFPRADAPEQAPHEVAALEKVIEDFLIAADGGLG